MRLIDADELIEQLTPPEDAQNNGAKLLLAVFVDAVKAFPTIDAVPVIRCADCVHCQYDAVYGDRWCDGARVKPDHFCGYGKRKSENVDRCVCCGAIIPEGRMVCPTCERRAMDGQKEGNHKRS